MIMHCCWGTTLFALFSVVHTKYLQVLASLTALQTCNVFLSQWHNFMDRRRRRGIMVMMRLEVKVQVGLLSSCFERDKKEGFLLKTWSVVERVTVQEWCEMN